MDSLPGVSGAQSLSEVRREAPEEQHVPPMSYQGTQRERHLCQKYALEIVRMWPAYAEVYRENLTAQYEAFNAPVRNGHMIALKNELFCTWTRRTIPLFAPPKQWSARGRHFWVVNFAWHPERHTALSATRKLSSVLLNRKLVSDGEKVYFWRNSGRYGFITARA